MKLITEQMREDAEKLRNTMHTLHKAALTNPASSACAEMVTEIHDCLNALAHQVDAFKAYQADIASGAVEYTTPSRKAPSKTSILRQAQRRGCTIYRGM